MKHSESQTKQGENEDDGSRRKGRAFWLRTKRNVKRPTVEPVRFNQHLTIDQLAAKRKLEQLWLLTQTDLALLNSAEPYRVSSFFLFKRNLLDPTLYITTSFVFLLSFLISGSIWSNFLLFTLIFTCLYIPINHHIEGYRSFVTSNENVKILAANQHLRKVFLSLNAFSLVDKIRVAKQPETSLDSFNWINQIITFFWPYLSHLIHYELNDFLRNQIEIGKLVRSDRSAKKLLYALVRQLDTHILVIEKCQLGQQAPEVKSISVRERKGGVLNKPEDRETMLVYDINLEYNGDMSIALIYKYFCCCSSRMGLKDIFLHIKPRVILGPIRDEAPFIDQVSFTLLDIPEFGYKGIALVELAELKVVRSVINRLIREHILQPNSVSVGLKALVETLLNGPVPMPHSHMSQSTSKNDNNDEVPLWTRLAARLLLCGCMCSNCCLMPDSQRELRSKAAK